MTPRLQELCTDVLNRITPKPRDRTHVQSLATKLTKNVAAEAKRANIAAEVRTEGSVAKDTWLRGEPEIDIFMRVPLTTPREAFGTVCLEIAKRATDGFKHIERFSEHPYLEAVGEKVRVNIVPCYKVTRGEWISATDRTPFHTDYVKPRLNEPKNGEVRLLKKFMKGIGVYGAEIKVGGFSGYLCELLIINYGSFLKVLGSATDWKERTIVDYERAYDDKDAEKLFDEPLVVIDPVDKGRNVAAAVKAQRLHEFIAAARAFLQTPRKQFFYPPPLRALTRERLLRAMRIRGSTIVFVKIGNITTVPDILWGQLYKSRRALQNTLRRNDFTVIRSDVWSDEKNLNVFVFEVETRVLPRIKKHRGPPITMKQEGERFLQKHRSKTHWLSGPRIEGGRWVIDLRREHRDVSKLLTEKLRDGGKQMGMATLLSEATMHSAEVLVDKEGLALAAVNKEFAKFLTAFLIGRPRWLN